MYNLEELSSCVRNMMLHVASQNFEASVCSVRYFVYLTYSSSLILDFMVCKPVKVLESFCQNSYDIKYLMKNFTGIRNFAPSNLGFLFCLNNIY